MVSPKTAAGTIENAIEQDSSLLNSVNDVIFRDPDLEGEDSHLKSPFMAIYPIDIARSSPHDTERVGYVTDDSGDRIGEVFRGSFDLPLQLDIYVAAGDEHNDASELGWELTKLLRPYDERNEALTLPDENGDPVTDVTHFRAGDGERADDLTRSPSVRRWRHEAMLQFVDDVEATDHIDTVRVVHTPSDGDFSSNGPMIEYDYV